MEISSNEFVGYCSYNNCVNLLTYPQYQFYQRLAEQKNFGWGIYWLANSTIVGRDNHSLTITKSVSGIDNDICLRIKGSQIILGRDLFGRSLFYYSLSSDRQTLWFASHYHLLPKDHRANNYFAIYGYSCFSYVPNPLTPNNNISTIKAGQEIVFKGNLEDKIFELTKDYSSGEWTESGEQITDETTAIEQTKSHLQKAIAHQIKDLKDEPVGVFLSGGLDSAIVTGLLVKAGVKVRAYTLDFGESSISEYPYAEQVANALKVPLIKVNSHPKQIKKHLLDTIKAVDLPFGDGVTVPLYLLGKTASQEVKIVFNGEGGDQLFGGWTNKPIIAAGIYQNEENFINQYLKTFHRLWGYEHQIFQPKYLEKIHQSSADRWLKTALDKTKTICLLHRLRRANLMLKGAQNIQPRATNLALTHNLQLRSIFCDRNLTNHTFNLSPDLLLQGSCEKYILKKAVTDLLPPEIIWRKKRGMGVPLTSWCLQEFWSDLGNWLNPKKLELGGIWQPNIASKIISGKLASGIYDRRIGEILWLIIIWQLWQENYSDRSLNYHNFPTSKHPFWLPPKLGKMLVRSGF